MSELPACYRCDRQPCECKDGVTLRAGDCRQVMAAMPAGSVDVIVTDPPYGIRFMGCGWDGADILRCAHAQASKRARPDGRQGDFSTASAAGTYDQSTDAHRAFQVWSMRWASEALRLAKPGCHLLAFGGTRTFHRLACAIEDAGWEIRDTIMWVYGSGFPKSLDVSKAIDKAAGAEREVVGVRSYADGHIQSFSPNKLRPPIGTFERTQDDRLITAPTTPAAREWSGYGTALKPAWEPIIVARKPLAGTVAANVQEHGCGALNVDGCRIGTEDVSSAAIRKPGSQTFAGENHRPYHDGDATPTIHGSRCGRWPANLVHDGSEEVLGLFPEMGQPCGRPNCKGKTYTKTENPRTSGKYGSNVFDGGYLDTGSAARFFYCAKADRRERGEGNEHPTVKPLALMDWLCRLVAPPGGRGVLLDPFAGSGSTLLAASRWFEHVIGIEQDPDYCRTAAARLQEDAPLFT